MSDLISGEDLIGNQSSGFAADPSAEQQSAEPRSAQQLAQALDLGLDDTPIDEAVVCDVACLAAEREARQQPCTLAEVLERIGSEPATDARLVLCLCLLRDIARNGAKKFSTERLVGVFRLDADLLAELELAREIVAAETASDESDAEVELSPEVAEMLGGGGDSSGGEDQLDSNPGPEPGLSEKKGSEQEP